MRGMAPEIGDRAIGRSRAFVMKVMKTTLMRTICATTPLRPAPSTQVPFGIRSAIGM